MRPICLLYLIFALSFIARPAELRLGIIGTDTSHATAFTRILNDAAATDHIPGARVVAAYKGGSPDLDESRDRVDAYAAEMKDKWQVRFVDKITDLCPLVDGILLESVDGRPHLAQFQEAVKCGKPVFIDKPLSSNIQDAREIVRLAAANHIPWFSASSLRFSDIATLKTADLTGVIVWAPGPLEDHHKLDLSWYGVHGVEMLYTVMGTGCVEVTRTHTGGADVVTGRWKDGRLGTVRLERPYGKYGGIAFREKTQITAIPDLQFSYAKLVEQIVKFMNTKTPPFPTAETIEMFEFMDAAQRSREAGGSPVPMK
jgi:Oxidoreductase family, NAD-binding Rossmann fold